MIDLGLNIFIIDGHVLRRTAIADILSNNYQCEIEGIESKFESIDITALKAVDVLICEDRFVSLEFIKSINRLKTRNPQLKLLILCSSVESISATMMELENTAIISTQDSTIKDMIDALKALKYFKKYIPSYISDNLSGIMSRRVLPGLKLTPREKQVLESVARGMSNKMIADELDISSRTVEVHRQKLMKKLSAHNTAEMIRKADLNKLIA